MFKTKWRKNYEKLYSQVIALRDYCERHADKLEGEPSSDYIQVRYISQKAILNEMLRIMRQEMES